MEAHFDHGIKNGQGNCELFSHNLDFFSWNSEQLNLFHNSKREKKSELQEKNYCNTKFTALNSISCNLYLEILIFFSLSSELTPSNSVFASTTVKKKN